jgi:hypothetical protein
MLEHGDRIIPRRGGRTGPFVPFTNFVKRRIHAGVKANLNLSLTTRAAGHPRGSFTSPSRFSNVTSQPRASSAEPKTIKTMTASFRKPGLLTPGRATLALPLPTPFTARVRTPTRPAESGSGSATREYRRTLRAAELAAWEAAAPSTAAQLRANAAAAAKDSPAEERWFAILLALALIGIAWGLADTFGFVERWPHFVAFLHQLIG